MTIEGKWWQSSERNEQVSYLTGRKITSNRDTKRFLLLTDQFSKHSIARALKAWRETAANLSRSICSSVILRDLVAKFECQTEAAESFGALLDAIFRDVTIWNSEDNDFRTVPWRRTDKTRIKELLIAFYREGLVTYPAFPSDIWDLFNSSKFTKGQLGIVESVRNTWLEASFSKFAHVSPAVTRMLLCRTGVLEVSDLTPNVMATDLQRHPVGPAMAKGLWQAQKTKQGINVVHSPEDFGPFGRRAERSRSGMKFEWALSKDQSLQSWCNLAKEFMETVQFAKMARQTALNSFFDHLLDNLGMWREPRSYFDRSHVPKPLYTHDNASTNNYVVEFFDWIIDTRFCIEDRDGQPVRMRGVANPLVKVKGKPQSDETYRNAMPSRLVRFMLETLTDNDWAWARSHEADYFRVLDEETGKWKRRWSPVRSVALFMMLRMPFRGFQIRTLDSGEADTTVFDLETQSMVKNVCQLHHQSSGKASQRGVLQMIQGSSGRPPHVILRIATNKTADIGKERWLRGYDCPYAPRDVVQQLCFLREWQSRYNQLTEPTKWADVREFQTKKSSIELIGMKSCFLFRDPLSSRPSEPVTHSRIWTLWLSLNAEVERKLNEIGITESDGSKIKLVSKWSDTLPSAKRRIRKGSLKISKQKTVAISAFYDLHSLRVTHITAFYEDGKVPPEVLMKIVGHATIMMTLYYTKLGVEYMAEEMSKAEIRVKEAEKDNWIRHQRSKSFESLQQAVSWNEDSGLTAFAVGAGSALQIMNVGICPVGCSQCDRGRKRVRKGGGHDEYVPVPGGRRNCAECRYLISGWPFRMGIQAEFNSRSFQLAQMTKRREELETAFEILDLERRGDAVNGRLFTRHREWTRASDNLESITIEADQIARELQNLAALDYQIAQLPNTTDGHESSHSVNLIVGDVGAVEAAFEETTEFDLADRICQSSVVFPAIIPSDANRARMRKYDQMLRSNGLPPIFLDLSDQEGLRVGNELSALLRRRTGAREHILRLVDGDETLTKLGILSTELLGGLEKIVGHRLRTSPEALLIENNRT